MKNLEKLLADVIKHMPELEELAKTAMEIVNALQTQHIVLARNDIILDTKLNAILSHLGIDWKQVEEEAKQKIAVLEGQSGEGE